MRISEEEAGIKKTGLSDVASLVADRELLHRDLLDFWHRRDTNELDRLSEYALVPPGKLLRPLLILESARCVGGHPEDLTELALSLEYLHVATLVHDDIIDGDSTRRGRPSVQAAFGMPAAIVAGDGLILETFATLAGARPDNVTDTAIVAVVAAIASAGLSVCRGQLLETELASDLDSSVDQYREMAGLKTGALFEAACRAGAILGTGMRKWVDALGAFGRLLGTAFQVRDDLLAFDGTPTRVGKPSESDLRNHRPTLPILLAHQRAASEDRERLEQAFAEEDPDAESYALVREIVLRTGAHEEAGKYAAEMIREAKHCLRGLPPKGTAALRAIADYASQRTF